VLLEYPSTTLGASLSTVGTTENDESCGAVEDDDVVHSFKSWGAIKTWQITTDQLDKQPSNDETSESVLVNCTNNAGVILTHGCCSSFSFRDEE